MNRETCEKCGESYGVGEDYRCPHGPVGRGGVIDDILPGGPRWIHNAGSSPVWIERKSEYSALLAQRGLVQTERKVYCKQDQSPYATKTRLRPGQRDPFLHRAS